MLRFHLAKKLDAASIEFFRSSLYEEKITRSSAYKRQDEFWSIFKGVGLLLLTKLTIPLIKRLKRRGLSGHP